MKTLFLVRHSKAVTRKANLPDFQRTLVKSGEKKATSMAKKLKKEGVTPDLMISSTANRALETAHLFAQNLDYPTHEIMVKDALYNEMSPEALLYLVRQVNDRYKSVMLFGHNPAFTDFACHLVKGFDQDIPKTGIVGIQFQKDNWKDVSKGSGKVEFFEYPRRVAKTMKRLEVELRSELAKITQDLLDKVDTKAAKKLKKQVEKASDKIAEDFVKILKAYTIKEEKKALAADKAKAAKPEPQTKPKPPVKPKATKPAVKTKAKTEAKPTPAATKAKAKATEKPAAEASPNRAKKTGPKKPAQAGEPKGAASRNTVGPKRPVTPKAK